MVGVEMGFQISPSEHVSIVGKTGSGKTVLARRLLKGMSDAAATLPFYYPIIILDNKGSLKTFAGFGKRIRKLKDLKKQLREGEPIIVYSPTEAEQTRAYYEGFFKYLYNLNKPLLVYVDELALVGHGNNTPEYYEKFRKQGRERLQTLWAATQNPVFVNHDFFSNADHFFIFDLILKADREKMAAFAGEAVKERPIDKHGFHYFSTGERYPQYFENKLDKKPSSEDNNSNGNINHEKEETESMSKKWIVSILVLGGVLVFVLPLWKHFFNFVGTKVPVLKPVADYTAEA